MRFTERDLARWVRDGLITSTQRDAMVADLSSQPSAPRIDITTLLYYGGGLLVLLAYSIFLGLQWEEFNSAARIAISASSLAFFIAVSQVLIRSERYRLPGELLQVAAVAVVPLLASALLEAMGWWPHEPDYNRVNYQEAWAAYAEDLTWARIALGGVTLVAAAAAFASSRSPFVLIAVFASLASLLLDATILVMPPSDFSDFGDYTWGAGQSLTVASVGAVALAGGVLSRDRGERNYSTWLYVFGIVALAVGLGTQALNENSNELIWGSLWMATAVALLVLSLLLQERLFAVAGLAGIFAYFAKLVFDVFESANAALALIVLGLAVLGVGMLYQRYSERLFTRSALG